MFYPKNIRATVEPWHYLPAAAGQYKSGQMLSMAAEKVTPLAAASTTTPRYLCMADVTVAEGDVIPVQRVVEGHVYVTALSEATDCAVGSKLQVSTGGLGVDKKVGGNFEVVYLASMDAGAEVHGVFV